MTLMHLKGGYLGDQDAMGLEIGFLGFCFVVRKYSWGAKGWKVHLGSEWHNRALWRWQSYT